MLIVNFATADVIDRETDTCKAGDIRRYRGDLGRCRGDIGRAPLYVPGKLTLTLRLFPEP